jgi:hypothetical protein
MNESWKNWLLCVGLAGLRSNNPALNFLLLFLLREKVKTEILPLHPYSKAK